MGKSWLYRHPMVYELVQSPVKSDDIKTREIGGKKMSRYAVDRENGGMTILALNAARDEVQKERIFCCADPTCPARVKVRSGPVVKPHFAALETAPHRKLCYYGSKHADIDPSKYDLNFDFGQLTDRILEEKEDKPKRSGKTGEGGNQRQGQKIPVHDLKTLYHLLKHYIPSAYVARRRVDDMLVDTRSVYKYREKGVNGKRIVEGELASHFYKGEELFLTVPDENGGLKVRIKFKDPVLFREVRGWFFKKNGVVRRDKVVVVLAKWSADDTGTVALIEHRDQILTV